jgi:hypothetical protein
VVCLLAASASCTNLVRKYQFREVNRHILIFFAINLTVESDHVKLFFTSKFSYLFVFNPTHKTGTASTGRGLLIANHLDQSL